MKFPKTVRTYCPAKDCRKHQEHTMKLMKNKPRPKTKKNALNKGARRVFKIMAGYGGMPRAKAATKHKQTTKPTFLLTCEKCGKSQPRSYKRLKRVTQV